MYNGIGLPTPRGSGTNGFVQRNLAHVRKTRQHKVDIVSKPDSNPNRTRNFELVMHEKKRQIEAKCLMLRKELEDERWHIDDIEEEVDHYRRRKLRELSKETESDHGERMKRSFGISRDYVDGSAVTQMKRNTDLDVKSEKVKTEKVKEEKGDKEVKKEVKEEPKRE